MGKIYDLEEIPTYEMYLQGMHALEAAMKDEHFRIFRAQYYAAHHTASSVQLAASGGIQGGFSQVNKFYGELGHRFCNVIGFQPVIRPKDSARWWAVWSTGFRITNEGFLWKMREPVVRALETLGWVQSDLQLEDSFDELQERRIAESVEQSEEARRLRIANAPVQPEAICVLRKEYRRNPDIVASALYRANGKCEGCGAFAPFLRSSDGTPYLEVHHLVSLAGGGEDSLRNVVALCPNCHREIHCGRWNEKLENLTQRVVSAPDRERDFIAKLRRPN